jgi:hypothetical protein
VAPEYHRNQQSIHRICSHKDAYEPLAVYMCDQVFIGWNRCARGFNRMDMSFRNNNHSRTRSSSCTDARGSIFKYETFLYIHTQLPSGEFIALRMRLSDDGHVLSCDQHRRTGNACGLQAYRGRSKRSGRHDGPAVSRQRA